MLDELAKHVSSHAVLVGGALADAGAVELACFRRDAIVARVRDGPVFDVALHAYASTLETSCSCLLHELGLVVCRHVWAMLVVAHRADALARWSGSCFAMTRRTSWQESSRERRSRSSSPTGSSRSSSRRRATRS